MSHDTDASRTSLPGDVDPERYWLEHVYRGDSEPQLTVRAVITGMLLGALMCLGNLYIALKTGWSYGVTITSGVLAFAIYRFFEDRGWLRRPFGILENNAMQSVASAAGYMTGGGTVAAIPALMMVTHQAMPWQQMLPWVAAIAMLGVFMAIPVKRPMINREGLAFPSGIAAAETLRALHGVSHPSGSTDGNDAGRARLLGTGGAIGAVAVLLREARARWIPWPSLPETLSPSLLFHGVAWKKWTLMLDTSPLLYAAGAIMGWRSAWSLLLGAGVTYGLLAPYGVSIHAIGEVKYKNIAQWTVWYGSATLLSAGLLSFSYSWRQVARAFRGVTEAFRPARNDGGEQDPLEAVEVPMRWFVIGVAVLTPIVVVLGMRFFGMTWWMGVLGVVLGFFISIVASRVTGETDTTPSGALGKVTQLVYGVAAPGSVSINLMAANLTAGMGIHAADLLTDLKSGHLLGARPRQQFLAQFFGVLAGSLAVVPAFRLLVPTADVIGTPAAPAPGAISWNAVAVVLANGLSRLPETARTLMLAGLLTGVVLTLLEKHLPKAARPYVPSAAGFGLAFTLPFSSSLAMFLGALTARVLEKRSEGRAEPSVVAVSSGIIAGESILGIAIAVLRDAFHLLDP